MGAPARRIRDWLRAPGGDGRPSDGGGIGYFARISMMGFGFTALATSFTVLILPMRILDVAPEESKNTYLGLLSFVGLVIAVLAQPLAGGLSDRHRTRWGWRRPFMVAGTVASLPLLLAAGVAQTYVQLFVFIAILQLFSNSAIGPYQALIRDQVPAARRGAASGMKVVVEVSGAMGVTVLVGVLMGFYTDSGNIAWLWASVALLAMVLLVGMTVTTRSIAEPAPSVREELTRSHGDTRAHPDFKWFLLSRFFIVMAAASIQTFALFYLRDSVGLDNPARVMSMLIPIVGVSVLLVAYPAGNLADRMGRKPVMAGGGVVAALCVVLLLAASNIVGVIVAAALAGVALAMLLGASWAMAADMVSARRTAQQMGYLNLATAGGAGMARLNGLWVDRLNSGGGDLGYSMLLTLCAILFLVGGLLIMRVRLGTMRRPDSRKVSERPVDMR